MSVIIMSVVTCRMSDVKRVTSVIRQNFKKLIFIKNNFLSDTRCQVSDVTLTIWGPEVMDVKYWIPTIICCIINFKRNISYISCRISVLCHLTNFFEIYIFCHMSGVICQMTSSECRTSEIKCMCLISEVGSLNLIIWCELIWYDIQKNKIKFLKTFF